MEMTTVIANHCEINKWAKNIKFTLKYTKCLVLTIMIYEHIWQFVATGTP